jgi:shikimate kinase
VRVAELIVITGPIGAGKSTVARGLADRFRTAGCSAAFPDVDDVIAMLAAPPEEFESSWRHARRVHGALIAAWLRSGVDAVIAHGPFYTADETAALLADVSHGQTQRRVMLLAPFEVALARVALEPERKMSKDPAFLRWAHERFNELHDDIPACEWVFDTTLMPVDAIVTALADSLVPRPVSG